MFFIHSTDGTKLAVYDYHPQGLKTMVFVHGWPLSHKIFEYQIGRLIDCGCRVVAFDLRGFGCSDTPADGYCYDQMADDLHCVVAALGLRRFTLTGFSMGGAIALRYMRRHCGQGVEKLVLLAAASPSWTKRPGFPYGLPVETVNQLIRQASTDRPKLARDFSHRQLFASPHSEAVKNWFQDIALSASGIGTVKAACALRDEDGRADLEWARVPTAIIHGDQDVIVSKELAVIQHRYIRDSRLFQLKNSGHGIMYDELESFNWIFFQWI